MNCEEKIKVFISSKCGGERVNFDGLLENPSKGKKEITDKAIRTNYDLIRRGLKIALEETGFIKTYVFEEDLGSTSSASDDYLNEIDFCHVCLFLIDNFDEQISQGLLKEITRAQNLNKKSIYIFLNHPNHEKTAIQEKLTGGSSPHYLEVTDIRDFISKGYESIICDIVKKYQLYSKKNVDLSEQSTSPIHLNVKVFPYESTEINEQFFEELGLTKNKLVDLVYKHQEKEIHTSQLDNTSLLVLDILLGERKLSESEVLELLESLSEIQTSQVHDLVKLRWEAIRCYYNNEIEKACKIYETIYSNYFKIVDIPKWLLNDVLIDWRFINDIKNQPEQIFDFSIQELIDKQESIIYFPIVDRLRSNINDELLEDNFNIQTRINSGISFHNWEFIFGSITNYLFTAVYYGSFVHLIGCLEQVQSVLFHLVQIDSSLLLKIQLMRVCILSGNKSDFSKIMEKYKSSLSNSTTKEIFDIYTLAEKKPIPYQNFEWQLLIFKEIGYYLSDLDFERISREIISNSIDILQSESQKITLPNTLIEALKTNRERIPHDLIIGIGIEIIRKRLFRLINPMFELLAELNFQTINKKILTELIKQVSDFLAEPESKKQLYSYSKFFIRVKKSRSDFGVKIDNLVKKHFPIFYERDYSLEVITEKRDIHIQRYLDSIKMRNKTQGKNGEYVFYGDFPYLIIKNIIEYDKVPLSVEVRDELLKEINITLFSETQTHLDKIHSIQLLKCLMDQVYEQDISWSDYIAEIKNNFSLVEKGPSHFFSTESVLLLKLHFILLRITLGEDCFQEILEILAYISNGSEREIVDSLILLEDFLKKEKQRIIDTPILSIFIQFISSYCFHTNDSIRFNTVHVLFQLIDSQYTNFILNRLVTMMDDVDFKVKWAIIFHASLVKQHSNTLFNYLIQKARIDNNYLVRKITEKYDE